MTSRIPVLELSRISKSFGRRRVLDSVSFSLKPGTIHALLGENGAGKTTLMRIAFGLLQPDSGTISIKERVICLGSPAAAIKAGIGMVHQQFSLIPAMTVAENVALGGRGRYSVAETIAEIAVIAARTGLSLDPGARVSGLGSAERQKLEIIRTLAHGADVMILDEPTAVLTAGDKQELFTRLRVFAGEGGSVVLITHKLGDVIEQADEVTVLRNGRVVMTSPTSMTTEQAIGSAMLGTQPTRELDVTSSKAFADREVVAALESVIIADTSRDTASAPVSLEVRAGEIVGIAALDGAAASLLRILAGRLAVLSGTVHLPPKIGFVPENRLEEGLIPDFSLMENMALSFATDDVLMNWPRIEAATTTAIELFSVATDGPHSTARRLSGGNQQRFILGRELQHQPPLLVLENPCQGLDVNAASFVHEQVRALRRNGGAMVFYSSDMDELAEISDRVLVVSPGSIIPVVADRQAIGLALLGISGGNAS
ncbi:MAG: ATP-binding cassette domain-containing protein [Gemmatimonadaceae bacterium]